MKVAARGVISSAARLPIAMETMGVLTATMLEELAGGRRGVARWTDRGIGLMRVDPDNKAKFRYCEVLSCDAFIM